MCLRPQSINHNKVYLKYSLTILRIERRKRFGLLYFSLSCSSQATINYSHFYDSNGVEENISTILAFGLHYQTYPVMCMAIFFLAPFLSLPFSWNLISPPRCRCDTHKTYSQCSHLTVFRSFSVSFFTHISNCVQNWIKFAINIPASNVEELCTGIDHASTIKLLLVEFAFAVPAVSYYKNFCLSPSKEICEKLLQSSLLCVGGPDNFDRH